MMRTLNIRHNIERPYHTSYTKINTLLHVPGGCNLMNFGTSCIKLVKFTIDDIAPIWYQGINDHHIYLKFNSEINCELHAENFSMVAYVFDSI